MFPVNGLAGPPYSDKGETSMTGALVTIAGNLTADPVLRSANGYPVVDFTVAHTARRLNRQTNEWENDGDTLFLRCSAWRELAENVAGSLRKGAAVFVEGNLEQRTYQDKEGVSRTVVECRAVIVAVDLRRQSVTGVMRIRKGGMPDDRPMVDEDAWSTPPADVAPAAAAA